MDCEVLLLTEVSERVELLGHDLHHGRQSMAPKRRWPAVASRDGVRCLTLTAPHQIDDLLSIDHIAVPKSWAISATQRHRAFVGESRISDHDAYVVEAASASTHT